MQRAKMVQREILLLPIGKILVDILEEIAVALRKIYGVHVRIGRSEEPETSTYSDERRQFNAEKLLAMAINRKRENLLVVLGVVDADMFLGDKTFIFGVHDTLHGAAVLALARLREEFYRKKSKRELFLKRAVTESIFQVGRALGLICQQKKCIMQEGTTLWCLDEKEQKFCSSCLNLKNEKISLLNIQIHREDKAFKNQGHDVENVLMHNIQKKYPRLEGEAEVLLQLLEPEGPMPTELAAIHPEVEGPEEPLIADRKPIHT
jgi:predicted Zn-dependent protease